MESVDTVAHRLEKSTGFRDGSAISLRLNGTPHKHAIGRLGAGFNLLQLVSEYRALRISVLSLWRATLPRTHSHDLDDVDFFRAIADA